MCEAKAACEIFAACPSQYLYNKILASVASPPGSSKIDAAETAIRYRLYECAVRRKSLHVAKRVV
jgi:hypothetical protein